MSDSMEMAGFTFSRDRIGKILGEIERRKKAARDFIGDTRNVEAATMDGDFCLRFKNGGPSTEVYSLNKNGARQLADTLDVPISFFERMRSDNRHRGELAHLSNHLLQAQPQVRMFRVLDGCVRAVLSQSYRILDNADLFFLAADEFQKHGAEIWEARLTDDSFRLYAVAKGISAEVRDEVIDGTHWRPEDGGSGKADRHVAAVALENSETGRGGMNIRPCTLRMVCANWNVWDKSLTQIHLGKKREEAGWISTDTQRLEDRLIWSKVRDVIRTAFDPARFEEVIAKLNGAKIEKTPDPIKAVEAAVEYCGLPDSSLDSIRAKFVTDKDFSRYGLVQAVTWQTHSAKDDASKDLYDDAGAKILASSMKAIMA